MAYTGIPAPSGDIHLLIFLSLCTLFRVCLPYPTRSCYQFALLKYSTMRSNTNLPNKKRSLAAFFNRRPKDQPAPGSGPETSTSASPQETTPKQRTSKLTKPNSADYHQH